MQDKIKSLLSEIQEEYISIAPNSLKRCTTEKVTEKDIAAFEKLIGEKLPDDYRSFLLNNEYLFDFCFNFKCLSLKEAVHLWKMMNELLDKGTFNDGRIKARDKAGNWDNKMIKMVWWSPKWIPFAEDSCANMFCIDLDPEKAGKKYQIINMELQDGQGPYCSGEYDSFLDFLEKHLCYLKNKQYMIDDDSVTIDPYIKPKTDR